MFSSSCSRPIPCRYLFGFGYRRVVSCNSTRINQPTIISELVNFGIMGFT